MIRFVWIFATSSIITKFKFDMLTKMRFILRMRNTIYICRLINYNTPCCCWNYGICETNLIFEYFILIKYLSLCKIPSFASFNSDVLLENYHRFFVESDQSLVEASNIFASSPKSASWLLIFFYSYLAPRNMLTHQFRTIAVAEYS